MKATLAIAILLAAALPGSAAIIVTAPTSTTPGSIQVTDDINFVINTNIPNAYTFYVVFDEWVGTSDGNYTASTMSGSSPFALKGVTPGYVYSAVYDNFATTYSTLTPKDGMWEAGWGTSISFVPGDIFTVKSGTYVLPPTASFNPQTTQTFTGTAFLINAVGYTRISADVTIPPVPEPAAASLAIVGLALAAGRRKRN